MGNKTAAASKDDLLKVPPTLNKVRRSTSSKTCSTVFHCGLENKGNSRSCSVCRVKRQRRRNNCSKTVPLARMGKALRGNLEKAAIAGAKSRPSLCNQDPSSSRLSSRACQTSKDSLPTTISWRMSSTNLWAKMQKAAELRSSVARVTVTALIRTCSRSTT